MRRPVRSGALAAIGAVSSLLGLSGAPSVGVALAAPDAEPALRSASEVVVRGKKTLEEAVRAAMPARDAGAPPPAVAFVVDVTPNVAKSAAAVRSTIAALARDATFAREVRVAPLGRALGAPAKDARLERDVDAALEKETRFINTMAELRKSLASLRGPAVAVYLCDWRFEDDFLVDALAADLVGRKIALGVVGTEAAFGRAWTDGSIDPLDRARGHAPKGGDYHPGIGRSPFGKPVADAPWHGGDSAYPAVPYRFSQLFWETEFQKASTSLKDALGGLAGGSGPGAPPREGPTPEGPPPEDLAERLGAAKPFDPDAMRTYPIPSAFGPYGLMRVAAVTGGRYALWSWNPGGRARVTYDYGRCNLLPPDLRARERILPELATPGLAGATIAAWHALLGVGGLVGHRPPLDRDLKSPRSVDDASFGSDFRITWDTPSDWKTLRRGLAAAIPAVAAARRTLEAAIASTKEPDGDLERRRLADARLFETTLAIVEFELHEMDLATKDVTPELWRKTPKGKTPGVAPRAFVVGAANPLAGFPNVTMVDGDDGHALDASAGSRIKARRSEHLERYKGTPFGAQVDLADVNTYRLVEWEVGQGPGRGGMPSESAGGATPPTTPPAFGGSSGGGGPTTGK
jgi:hypothetical protein